MREYLGTAFLPPPSPSQGPDKEGVTDLPSWGISSRRRSPGWIGGDSGEVAGGGGQAFYMGGSVMWARELRAAPDIKELGREARWSARGLEPPSRGEDPQPALP